MGDFIDQEFFNKGALGAARSPHCPGAAGVELDIPVVPGV
jgi:hypothetical protein